MSKHRLQSGRSAAIYIDISREKSYDRSIPITGGAWYETLGFSVGFRSGGRCGQRHVRRGV
ncbi:MAG: hypothetical protein Q4B72_15745, partial [Lachnospiraceae bacterium]|nr:hypothetical protein [Lachnospiraceae bacterium]